MKRVEGVMHPSWGRTPKEEGRRCLSFLFGVKNAVLVPLRVFSLKRSTAEAFAVPVRVLRRKEAGGGVAEWIRALDLKSGGPWFKSSVLLLSGFVLGSPEFNSSAALCK